MHVNTFQVTHKKLVHRLRSLGGFSKAVGGIDIARRDDIIFRYKKKTNAHTNHTVTHSHTLSSIFRDVKPKDH